MILFRTFARRRPVQNISRNTGEADLENSEQFKGIMKDISEILAQKERQGLSSEDALAELFGRDSLNKFSKAYESLDGSELSSKDLNFEVPKELEDLADRYFKTACLPDLTRKASTSPSETVIPEDIQKVTSN
jgi:hypothetical protein